jgi:tetratricopeptide (TPR) repeat protein
MSGDLALLGWGILGAYAFWKWRSAHALLLLATPLHDAARLASGALAESPDDPEALRTLGAAQLAAGDPAALETLAHAHAVAPNDPETELLLGRAHLERGEARTAADHLRHAGLLLEDHPDEDEDLLFEVTLALSAARIALGDAEGAILTAEAARRADPADPRGLLMIADALVAGGRLDEARSRLEGALGASEGPLRREIERRLAALRRLG